MSTASSDITVRQISFIGGGYIIRKRWTHWNSASLLWPLARLTLRDDGIALRVGWLRVWFPREKIRLLKIQRRWCTWSVRIVPFGEEAEDLFGFGPLLSLRPVLLYLLTFRYPVGD
jgi:hypothetical protein